MIVLLDNTVLSNFALVERTDILQTTLGTDAATTPQVMSEFRTGVARGKIPESSSVEWLPVLALSSAEEKLYQSLQRRLNAGEAACLAVAAHREARVLTDDRDARVLAGRMKIPISGTLGVLVRAVRTEQLKRTEADELLRQMIARNYRSPVESISELL